MGKDILRKDVKSIVLEQKESNTGDVVFEAFSSKEELGKRIFENYKQKRISNNDGRKVFYSDDKSKRAGFLSNVYGNVGVMTLVNRMNVELGDEDKAELEQNICYILDYIEKNGYTLYPYISEEDNKDGATRLFNRNYPHIGSMTWAISFFVSVRKACRQGVIDLEKYPSKKSLNETYSDVLIKQIKEIIVKFNEAFIDDGELLGWSFTKECETPSLFYTYSVLEAFSDFDDNVLNLASDDSDAEEDKELIDAINGDAKYDERLTERWKKNCYRVADKAWDAYKDVLKDSFIDDNFLKGFKTISRSDIVRANSSNALFNTIYLVFILFYGYVNSRKEEDGDHAGADDVVQTMKAALQNVQRIYDQLKGNGLGYIVDTYYIVFNSKNRNSDRGDKYTVKFNRKKLVDAKLLPTLVKANNVIAFYIDQYPVKQMSELFKDLLNNLPAKEGVYVWEADEYDVKITERYIEAIADFYAYYDKYERLYSENFNQNYAITERERRDIEEQTKRLFGDEIREGIEKEFAEREKSIRKEYSIENAINERIESTIEACIISAMKKIISSNEGEKVELSTFEDEFKELLYRLMLSYTDSYLISTSEDKKIDLEQMRKNRRFDIDLFMEMWSESLSKSNSVVSALLKEEK
ncbi:MAG: hypothetical protein E7516_07685 [Ruminococcaceae bacterium]|nr:hypothetical protein [Oscillospiraceae bacterium]